MRSLWLLVFSLICIIPEKKIFGVTIFGMRTLQVYMWHWPIAKVVEPLTESLYQSPQGKLIWIIMAIVLSLMLSLRLFGMPIKSIYQLCEISKCSVKDFFDNKV